MAKCLPVSGSGSLLSSPPPPPKSSQRKRDVGHASHCAKMAAEKAAAAAESKERAREKKNKTARKKRKADKAALEKRWKHHHDRAVPEQDDASAEDKCHQPLAIRAFCSAITGQPRQRPRSGKPCRVSENISNDDIHSFTKIISSHCRNNRLDNALRLFEKMSGRDTVTWNTVIKGCLDCGDTDAAKRLFAEMPERNVVSWTIMINGYLKFGEVEAATKMFDQMPSRDITTWNIMLHGYCQNGRVDNALNFFAVMPVRDVISWTTMICGLDMHGRSSEALRLFKKMLVCGIQPTSNALSSVIVACGNLLALEGGLQIHALVRKIGFFTDDFICSSLITFYAKCNQTDDFSRVFAEKDLHDNVVVWTSLLTGYSLNSKHECALTVLGDMMENGVVPNQSSFTSALNSCCGLGALDTGKEIHAISMKLGHKTDVFVGNSLIILYSRCGSMNDGLIAFKLIENKSPVSWNSVITGCAHHGYDMWVFALFSQMLRGDIEPDGVTLTGLLYACNHSSMLLKGRKFIQYFSQYKSGHLKAEHYACMVSIFGSAGKLNEAEEFIGKMPIKANSMVWLALLSSCRTHSDLEVAERAAKHVFHLEPHNSTAYILLSNLYASANKWSDVSRIRWEMKNRRILKQQGSCWFPIKQET